VTLLKDPQVISHISVVLVIIFFFFSLRVEHGEWHIVSQRKMKKKCFVIWITEKRWEEIRSIDD